MLTMNPELTQPSLLSRVRDPSNDAAWREFEAKYRELLVRFCRRQGWQLADAEDLVQTVMASLVKSLPGFVYDKARGRFRDYLYRAVRNAMSQRSARPKERAGALDMDEGAWPGAASVEDDPALVAAWEQEWVHHHYRMAMVGVRKSFEARSVEVFERSVAGESVESLAGAFGMSTQAVHKVRQRIRARLEELIAAQIRDEDRVDE
jgi:RNA polymerase sigma-70 factor (ECF subfamily)